MHSYEHFCSRLKGRYSNFHMRNLRNIFNAIFHSVKTKKLYSVLDLHKLHTWTKDRHRYMKNRWQLDLYITGHRTAYREIER